MANRRTAIVVIIAVAVGLLHIVTGPNYKGPFPLFVNGYLIDILLPFSMYLVAGLVKHPLLSVNYFRAMAVVVIGFTVETLQYFNIEILGRTFDPLDYLMYAIGVFLGIFFEVKVLSCLPDQGNS